MIYSESEIGNLERDSLVVLVGNLRTLWVIVSLEVYHLDGLGLLGLAPFEIGRIDG